MKKGKKKKKRNELFKQNEAVLQQTSSVSSGLVSEPTMDMRVIQLPALLAPFGPSPMYLTHVFFRQTRERFILSKKKQN